MNFYNIFYVTQYVPNFIISTGNQHKKKKASETFCVLFHTKSRKSGVYFPLTAIYTVRSHHVPSAH